MININSDSYEELFLCNNSKHVFNESVLNANFKLGIYKDSKKSYKNNVLLVHMAVIVEVSNKLLITVDFINEYFYSCDKLIFKKYENCIKKQINLGDEFFVKLTQIEYLRLSQLILKSDQHDQFKESLLNDIKKIN